MKQLQNDAENYLLRPAAGLIANLTGTYMIVPEKAENAPAEKIPRFLFYLQSLLVVPHQ